MKKVKIIILIVLAILAVVGVTLVAIGYLVPKGAGLSVKTNPVSTVFIDGVEVGKTPYSEVRKAQEIVVKLVPESFDKPLVPYETKVKLVSGVESVMRRDFGESEDGSSGETVSFEKVAKDEGGLAVVTVPDASQINIDSQPRGFAPYKTTLLAQGDHTLTVSSPNHLERTLQIKTRDGYLLTAFVKLAQKAVEPTVQEESKEDKDEDTKEEKEIMVEILSTPVGYLRVREEPSTSGEEVGRVKPGDQFVLIEEDEKTGWYKIEYEVGQSGKVGKQGWISNQYAKKLGSTTPTPSPTPAN